MYSTEDLAEDEPVKQHPFGARRCLTVRFAYRASNTGGDVWLARCSITFLPATPATIALAVAQKGADDAGCEAKL